MTPIQDYLMNFSKSGTKSNYTSVICRYLEFVAKLPKPAPNTPVDFPKYESLAVEYIQAVKDGKRILRNDINQFTVSLHSSSAFTQKRYPRHILRFLKYHDVVLPENHRDFLNTRAIKARPTTTTEEFITKDIIQKMCTFANPQMRALIYFMLSTGCRISEALNVHVDEIMFDENPPRVYIRKEISKNDIPRNVFLTKEATEILKIWVLYRNEYISKKRGLNEYRDFDNKKLFPFTRVVAHNMWELMLKKAQLYKTDPETHRMTIHPHSLRKYFRRILPTGSKNPKAVELTEKLMGHEGYLGGVYSNVDLKELAAFFKEAETALWIDSPVVIDAAEVEELRKRVFILEKYIIETSKGNWEDYTRVVQEGNAEIDE